MRKGTGSAGADAQAEASGRLSAESSATGGSKDGPVGPRTSTSSGTAVASVFEGYVIEAGSYDVTVTYSGVVAQEAAVGTGTSAVVARAEATLDSGLHQPPVLGTARIDVSGQTVTLSFRITVRSAAGINVEAELQAKSSARGNGNSATTTASATTVGFELDRAS